MDRIGADHHHEERNALGSDRSDGPARPSIRSIAASLAVSPALVSLALNGKPGVSEARRAEIRQRAEEVGYSPSPVARALQSGTSPAYGLIVRNFVNPFFNDLLIGMQDAGYESGRVIVALDSGYSSERELLYMRNLAASHVGALAIAPIGDAETVREWQRLMPHTPTVLINADGMPAPGVLHVSPDSEQAVSQPFRHLYQLGHRRIAFLCAPTGLMADSARLNAYLLLCTEHALKPMLMRSKLDFDSLVDTTQSMLCDEAPPSAIIANSDFAAHAIYTACHTLGLRVGVDLSVTGHDDLPTSALLAPPLTTVNVDRHALGKQVYLRLAGDIAEDHYQPVALMVRDSTGPPVLPSLIH